MEQEDRELLRRIFNLTERNTKAIESIQRSMFWGRIMRIIYWVIIIGGAIGLYYFIEPYVDQVLEVYGGIKGGINNLFQ